MTNKITITVTVETEVDLIEMQEDVYKYLRLKNLEVTEICARKDG